MNENYWAEMTNQELVKKLRFWATEYDIPIRLVQEAADRIEKMNEMIGDENNEVKVGLDND